MDGKHVATPYSLENDPDDGEYWNIRALESTDNGDIVAVVPKTGDPDYDNDVVFPTASFLVRAANAHEDLLLVLKGFMDATNEDVFTDAPEMSKAVGEVFDAREAAFMVLTGIKTSP